MSSLEFSEDTKNVGFFLVSCFLCEKFGTILMNLGSVKEFL